MEHDEPVPRTGSLHGWSRAIGGAEIRWSIPRSELAASEAERWQLQLPLARACAQ